MNYQVLVISLSEAEERRAHMRRHLAEFGIDFTFFDAVDGRGFDMAARPDYNGLRRRLCFGKDMTGGELGCALSHKALYQKMIDENIPLALVLEDDALLDPEAPGVIDALITGGFDFDLVRLLGSRKVAGLQQDAVFDLGDGYTVNRLRTTPGGAHAYIITQNGARKLLKAMQRIDLPIDTLMGQVWRTGLKAYIIQPGLSFQDEAYDSFIGDQRFDKSSALSGWERIAYPVTRACYKLYEAVCKQVGYTILN